MSSALNEYMKLGSLGVILFVIFYWLLFMSGYLFYTNFYLQFISSLCVYRLCVLPYTAESMSDFSMQLNAIPKVGSTVEYQKIHVVW